MGLSSGSLHTLGMFLGTVSSDYTRMKRTRFYQRHNIPGVRVSKGKKCTRVFLSLTF